MNVALAFVKRDFQIAISYRVAFAMQLLGIFFATPILYFVGKFFSDQAGPDFLKEFNGNYFAFLLIGVALLDYLNVSLQSFSRSLRESQLMGTLEIVLLSPTSLAKLLIYSSLFVYLFTSIRFILYLTLGLILGVDIHPSSILPAVIILFTGVISFAAFGIISASVIMLLKRGMGVTTVISAASLFFGGVLYSTTALPWWLEWISELIPFTHALRGMRSALLQGSPIIDLLPHFLFLILFAVILLPLSLVIFWFAVRRTKVTGTLAQY